MIPRQAISVVMAAAAITNSVSGFMATSSSSTAYRSTTSALRPLHVSSSLEQEQLISDSYHAAAEKQHQAATEAAVSTEMVSDIPPTPTIENADKMAAAMLISTSSMAVESESKRASPNVARKRKGGKQHTEGLLSPIVYIAKGVLGQDELKKVRAKVISIHSDIIKSFVGTSDSDFGKAVLRQLFNIVDADSSGYLDKSEINTALSMLGFKWLGDKEVNRIFGRADANGDQEISLEEFMNEAPKTLKTNLIKLAKVNGNDLGLLV